MKADGVTVYTAIAGGQQATGALTALGDSLAERQSVPVTVREVVPVPDDDPTGTGLASAAVTAVLQFGIGNPGRQLLAYEPRYGTRDGGARGPVPRPRESLFDWAGFGAGSVVMMFFGNQLSGLATGPYWLPDGWSTLGQSFHPGPREACCVPTPSSTEWVRADRFSS
ncbi:hypothetical protein [Streptomyces sp. NPDC056405]|uniref:hypothetical protein n=1 Tax=Streptomyces sp. NPDC056405 TaxID=3345811 RepID=UPI0035DC6E8F